MILAQHESIFAKSFIVPTFEGNRMFTLGAVFFQSIFADRNNSFQKNFLNPIEDIDFQSSNLKNHFTSNFL